MRKCDECGETRNQVQPWGRYNFCTDRACASVYFDELAFDREAERQYEDFHSRED